MIKAVIFDMDGLMFDTEALAKKGWLMVGRELNLPITDEILHKVIGMNAAGVKETCLDYFGADFRYDDFRQTVANYMNKVLEEDGMPVKQGLPELLDYLKEHRYQTAVASSSSRATVEDYLRRAKLEDTFSALVCGDMITRGKPEPDIFLKAAEELDTAPADCLILEDSANGIRAAHAAGMRAIMVPDLIEPTPDLRAMASRVCKTLHDVIPFLEDDRKGEHCNG
jgi:HAD superfamily hydrolase (TIGR01509 family)